MCSARQILFYLCLENGGSYLHASAYSGSMIRFLRVPLGRNNKSKRQMNTDTKPSPSPEPELWHDVDEDVINQYCAEAVLFWKEETEEGIGNREEQWLIDDKGKRTYMTGFWKPCTNPSQAKEVLAEVGWMLQACRDEPSYELHGKMGMLGTAASMVDVDPHLALVIALDRVLNACVPDFENKEKAVA